MVDRAIIEVKGGDGGNGCICFRREKFIPFGGPDGGDGGNGGAVILLADPSVKSLRWASWKRHFAAEKGGNGSGKNKHGKNGSDLVIKVPVGTEIHSKDNDSGILLVDLSVAGQQYIAARGGKGGRGNARFVSSIRQAPRMAEKGEPGESTTIRLDLKLIAEVGIIGKPNAGKSTLLAMATRAHPKIAAYPFTTLEPAMGVADVGYRQIVMAEIPGLIEGAHLGLGLGHDFLRHSERTKVFIHLIDGSSDSPLDDLEQVNQELACYKQEVAGKPQIVVVNKVDMPEVRERVDDLKNQLSFLKRPVHFISAASGEGVPELIKETARLLDQTAGEVKVVSEPQVVLRPLPEDKRIVVTQEGGVYHVASAKAEQLVVMTDLTNAEARLYLKEQLARIGAIRALTKAGVKPGDRVLFGKVEMEWQW
jgi:GTPase